MSPKKPDTTETKAISKNTKMSKQVEDIPVVIIGASAGGLQAIYSVFENIEVLEQDYCIVIMQHLSPDYKSLMPELLGRHTQMKVVPIEDGMELERGVVFVGQPNKTIRIDGTKFTTEERMSENGMYYPINAMFNSFADSDFKTKVAVILSGSGSDGTVGVKKLKEKGAYIIVQDENTATFNGMPKSAISSGVVDRVVSPELIAETIVEIIEEGISGPGGTTKPNMDEMNNEELIGSLLNVVKKVAEIDFSEYKTNTIYRRLERRMKKCQVADLGAYADLVHSDTTEAKRLASEFLINVTNFFRDRDAFVYVKNLIVPQLFKDAEDSGQLRVWSVGCATGQEAYTFAMLLHDFAQANHITTKIKVFATDAHTDSLNYASRGLYTIEEVEAVPTILLEKYFIKQDEFNYQIKNQIRDLIVFAVHNVVKDPPFHNIHFVSCRNLLIYLKADVQQKILSFLHFSLVENGKLFLGGSETPTLGDSSFQAINSNFRIFRKVASSKASRVVGFYSTGKLGAKNYGDPLARSVGNEELTAKTRPLIEKIKDDILDDVMPPSVVVNEMGDVLHVFGEIERYLHFPKKTFHLNLLKMVPESLFLPINNLMTTVKSRGERVVQDPITIFQSEKKLRLQLTGAPVNNRSNQKGNYYTIVFNTLYTEEIQEEDQPTYTASKEEGARVRHLEEELKETKDYLQNTVEELETSNEELQATNEELIASNEELQSTNEELQSVNEELYSVNTEFQSKVNEMIEANDDLKNLLQSTELGTIFLDRELKIRRYTDAIKDQMNVTESDMGRPISDLNNKLVDVDLGEGAKEVLRKLEVVEEQVVNTSGKDYLMRMVPYRNSDEKIDGVVITFVNIEKLKKVEQNLKEKTRNLGRINRELEQVAYVATHDLRAPVVNMEGLLDIHIKRQKLDPQEEVVRKMRENIKRILSTLDGLIEIVSYQNDGDRGNTNVDLNEILSGIVDEVKDLHPSASIEWDLEVSKIRGIKGYFRSIFQNLILNSIKYSKPDEPAKVAIRTYRKLKNSVVIEVEDEGIGIDPKYFDIIFKPFKRVAKGVEGKGIGLYLVKSQIEAMNGNIRIESQEGEGTKFIINL